MDGDLTCRELVELVTDHLEGALPAELDALLTAHLGDCAACREYVAQMRRTLDLLAALPAARIGHPACVRVARACRPGPPGSAP